MEGYYVLFVFGAVDPSLSGPYPTAEERDAGARRLRADRSGFDADSDSIFWLDATGGKLTTGSYAEGDLLGHRTPAESEVPES